MAITLSSSDNVSTAFDLARRRGVLPLTIGSAEIKQLEAAIKRQSVFSAKVTSATFLQAVKNGIDRILKGGYNNDPAQIRTELKELLVRLGYTPERGFPGDRKLGIEPAEPGTLQDISSDRRLNLILRTQQELNAGSAQKLRGESGSRLVMFPFWELVRVEPRRVPRDWKERFKKAGGVISIDHEGRERMIAPKGSDVWRKLGSSALFSDALDTDHSPFAFESGKGLREVHWREAENIIGREAVAAVRTGRLQTAAPSPSDDQKPRAKAQTSVMPAPKASASGLDADTINALKKSLPNLREKAGNLTMDDILNF